MIGCKRCYGLVQCIHAKLRTKTNLSVSFVHSHTRSRFYSKRRNMYLYISIMTNLSRVCGMRLVCLSACVRECVHFLSSLTLCLSNLAIFVGTFTFRIMIATTTSIIILVRVNMCCVYGFLISSYLRSRLINCFLL